MLLVHTWPFFQLSFFWQYRPGKCLSRYSRVKRPPFKAIKTTSSKSPKIDIFPKGLTHGFGPKMAIFPNFFFWAIQAKKMFFTIFQNEKTPFQATKTRTLKIDIFAKGLTHGFGPKMAIFPTFSFRQFRPIKCLLRYSRTKKRLSRV